MLKHAKTIDLESLLPQPRFGQHGTTRAVNICSIFSPVLISLDPWVCSCLLIGDDFACLWQLPYPEDLQDLGFEAPGALGALGARG